MHLLKNRHVLERVPGVDDVDALAEARNINAREMIAIGEKGGRVAVFAGRCHKLKRNKGILIEGFEPQFGGELLLEMAKCEVLLFCDEGVEADMLTRQDEPAVLKAAHFDG